MERIFAAADNCDKILALITAALEVIAAKFIHTSELQSGGRFAGKNVMPELTAQFAGVNVTNTPVERAFRLEKKKHKSVESANLRRWRQIRNRLRPGAAASFPPCRAPVHRVIPKGYLNANTSGSTAQRSCVRGGAIAMSASSRVAGGSVATSLSAHAGHPAKVRPPKAYDARSATPNSRSVAFQGRTAESESGEPCRRTSQ